MSSTLRRAAIWSGGETIRAEDLREALLERAAGARHDVLGRPLGEGLDLPALLAEVARHYLERALAEAHGVMTHARNQVDVVGHEDEATAVPMIASRAVEQEGDETLEGVLVIEHAGAAIHANRQQVGDVSVAVGPDTMQATQAAWGFVGGIGDAV